jgi:hypothetical protein
MDRCQAALAGNGLGQRRLAAIGGAEDADTVTEVGKLHRDIPLPCLEKTAYWKAVSKKLLSLREWSFSDGISAIFWRARMPIWRCWLTCVR